MRVALIDVTKIAARLKDSAGNFYWGWQKTCCRKEGPLSIEGF